MSNLSKVAARAATAQIIDFDEVLIQALSPDARLELYAEAAMLAEAFAPARDRNVRPDALEDLARALASGDYKAEIGHHHARRLSAALRLMAKTAN